MPTLTPLHDLPLPDYARIDLARYTIISLPEPGSVQRVVYNIPGEVICVVEAVSFLLTTSAVVQNRGTIMSMRDQDLVDVMRIATPSDHPASTSRQYNFLSTMATIQGVFGFDYMAPVPPAVALPGYQISLFITPFNAGDTMSKIRLTCIHIPTGPERPATLVPQPLALT